MSLTVQPVLLHLSVGPSSPFSSIRRHEQDSDSISKFHSYYQFPDPYLSGDTLVGGVQTVVTLFTEWPS